MIFISIYPIAFTESILMNSILFSNLILNAELITNIVDFFVTFYKIDLSYGEKKIFHITFQLLGKLFILI